MEEVSELRNIRCLTWSVSAVDLGTCMEEGYCPPRKILPLSRRTAPSTASVNPPTPMSKAFKSFP